jgi:GNAT superfamily N-acetyltransferase
MTSDYANLTNSDPYRDVIIAEVDGLAVAYGRTTWEDENDGLRSYDCFGFVDPVWRRRGLGRAMLHHNLRRLRSIAATHPGDRPRSFGSWTDDASHGTVALLTDEGFVPVRTFPLMVRSDLEDVDLRPVPAGLEIRAVTESDLHPLFVAENEAFLDHFGGIDVSDEAYRRWRGHPTFDPSLYLVAWDGDQIAGGVLTLIDPAENEVHGYRRGLLASVFTRRAWRQRGLARSLIGRSLVLLREREMTSAQLGVDLENPHQALRLYEESGFRIASRSTAFRRAWD